MAACVGDRPRARAARHRRRAELLDLVGMQEWAGKRRRQYSKGMRRRIGVAQSLMHDPDLVILDEPIDGVDPVGRRGIRWLVQQLKERGKTVRRILLGRTCSTVR